METLLFGAISVVLIWLLVDQCKKWVKDKEAVLNGEEEPPNDGLLLRLWKRRR